MRRLIIADLDDTLIDSEIHIYGEGQKRVLSFLQEKFAVSKEEFALLQRQFTHALHEKINPRTKKPYHYSLERYTHGLRDCYHFLCEKHCIKKERKVSDKILEIAESVFTEEIFRTSIKPDIFPFMRFCRESETAVFVLTKGEKTIQNAKLRILYQELEKQEVHAVYASEIVPCDKTPEHFSKLMGIVNGKTSDIYVMGNSFEKDIRPALDVFSHVRGIFVPCAIWESDVEKEKETARERYKDRCHIVADLVEAVNIFKNETAIV